jgi:hypothetical protein
LSALLWVVLVWRQDVQQGNNGQNSPDRGTSNEVVVVTHTYSDGLHTLRGKLFLPTPCHELETDAVVMESLPEQVNVNLNIVEPGEKIFCIQVIDERDFEVTFQASPSPSIRGFVNGEPVTFAIEDETGTLTP